MTDPTMPVFAVTKPWPPSLQSGGGSLLSLFMRSQSLVSPVLSPDLTQQHQMILLQAEVRGGRSCSAPRRHPRCFRGELGLHPRPQLPDGTLPQPTGAVSFIVHGCLQADLARGGRWSFQVPFSLVHPSVDPQRMSPVTAARAMNNCPLQDPSPEAKFPCISCSLATDVVCLRLSAWRGKDEDSPRPVPAHPLR